MTERYSSGSSLRRTVKEEHIDSLERALWTELADEVFVDLKKLKIGTMSALHKALQERIAGACEQSR